MISDLAAPPIDDPHVNDRVSQRHIKLDFNVELIEDVRMEGPAALMEREWMSPYVWLDTDGRYGLMVRAVPKPGAPRSDTGMVWGGWSSDGTNFVMLDAPSVVPGPDAFDAGGVEDPTVVQRDDGSYLVYYTGVLADQAHGELCFASGPPLDRLNKRGVVLASTKSEGNTKEATIERTADNQWRLFYEYAADNASRIGLALGADCTGPWIEQPTPFMPRERNWNDWHLSTGPLLTDDPDIPVMFYNGATRDARWRIGWIAFDRDCQTVLDRGIQPLITPPPIDDRTVTDIAFAASVIVREHAI
jgi:beta-1,2-mannobiose phosphorylase / 1,2-beta-oligomannan phosphorylase